DLGDGEGTVIVRRDEMLADMDQARLAISRETQVLQEVATDGGLFGLQLGEGDSAVAISIQIHDEVQIAQGHVHAAGEAVAFNGEVDVAEAGLMGGEMRCS
ncbi:MAG: hypothetical protein K0Q55_4209, partial [Verrucomicrobia bacterium]|nr:hypothetical protein [Verrucomicrobiota bacterium]